MKNVLATLMFGFIAFIYLQNPDANGCTNFLFTKGATADGSTMITYAADSHDLYGELEFIPAGDHIPGSLIDVYEWDTNKHLGQITQVAHTYTVVGMMNEHQVALGETTYGGRKELQEPNGIVDYGSLMKLALQRGKTAREAITIMGDLVAEYGYASEGESFSISDPNEAWIMDLIGKGKGEKGAVWVARRIPDGYIAGHANQARIRQFPLNDKENCLYAKDVISFARKKGYFNGKDEEFSFADTYSPLTFELLRICEARVWEMFRRAAPSLNLSADYIKGVPGAQPVPLWIKPDKKLTVHDVMELMRDHFEGSDLDMTKDVGAGPFILPYRWRPLTWKIDKVEYFNERAVSTQQTGYSFVAQSRSWLPDFIGGVFWFGVDDTYSTVYVPMYCSIKNPPKNYAHGVANLYEFSWDSAFWVFNAVANFAYSRYSDMIKDIQVVQRELEGKFLSDQAAIEKAALELHKQAPELAREYLTKYSETQSDMVIQRWKKLFEFLLVKYMDGNVKDSQNHVQHPPYPDSWYKRIIQDTGDKFKIKPLPGEKKEE